MPNDRPFLHLELQPDALKVQWGPPKGPWGIYYKCTDPPAEVVIKEWHFFLGSLVNAHKPEFGSTQILSSTYDLVTDISIPRGQLPKKKKLVAQIIGYFDSKKPDGTTFTEGIYSDPAYVET